MKKIICKVCDGDNFSSKNGEYICNECNTIYSAEEIREMMVEVKEKKQNKIAEEKLQIENIMLNNKFKEWWNTRTIEQKAKLNKIVIGIFLLSVIFIALSIPNPKNISEQNYFEPLDYYIDRIAELEKQYKWHVVSTKIIDKGAGKQYFTLHQFGNESSTMLYLNTYTDRFTKEQYDKYIKENKYMDNDLTLVEFYENYKSTINGIWCDRKEACEFDDKNYTIRYGIEGSPAVWDDTGININAFMYKNENAKVVKGELPKKSKNHFLKVNNIECYNKYCINPFEAYYKDDELVLSVYVINNSGQEIKAATGLQDTVILELYNEYGELITGIGNYGEGLSFIDNIEDGDFIDLTVTLSKYKYDDLSDLAWTTRINRDTSAGYVSEPTNQVRGAEIKITDIKTYRDKINVTVELTNAGKNTISFSKLKNEFLVVECVMTGRSEGGRAVLIKPAVWAPFGVGEWKLEPGKSVELELEGWSHGPNLLEYEFSKNSIWDEYNVYKMVDDGIEDN